MLTIFFLVVGLEIKREFAVGHLAGIGFTMSLFIAGQAFPAELHFAAAKIAVFAASMLSATIGVALLWGAKPVPEEGESDDLRYP